MDVVTPLMQTLKAQANIEHERAITEDTRALGMQRMLNTQLLNTKIQQDMVTRNALKDALQGGPTMDPGMEPASTDTAIQSGQKNVQRLQFQAAQADRLAGAVLKAGGDPIYVDKLRDDATQARYRATQAQRELMAERSQQMKLIGSVAMGATNEESFRPAYEQIAKVDPQLAQSLIFDKDTLGAPVWGPKTQRTMATLANAGMTAHEQAEVAVKAGEAASKAAEREEKSRVERARVDELDSQTLLNRARAKKVEVETGEVGRPKPGAAAKPVAARPATKTQKDAAFDAVTTEFPDVKFEPGARERMAADIADRANTLVAQAKNAGDDLSYDDAREQALQELKGFVADKTTKKERGFGLLPDEVIVTKTYTRGGKQNTTAAPAYPEGTMATNPQTGQKLIFKGGKWQTP